LLSKNIIALTYDDDYINFLREIIRYRVLYDPAHGIAEMIVAGRINQLSEKQARVYKWYIYDRFKQQCEKCGVFIPWRDMFNAVSSGDLCVKCFMSI
jgi:phosphomannomutase